MPFITQGKTNWKFILVVIILAIIVGAGALWYAKRPEQSYQPVEIQKTEKKSTQEQACLNSGGTISTASCCQTASDFPSSCLVGACGCSPDNSHQVKVCDCGTDKCFDGEKCSSIETTPAPSIDSISPNSGPIGTVIELQGKNFSGFEGDLDAWIENTQGVKGIIYGETGSNGNLIKFTLKSSYCQIDTSYSGLPCSGFINLTPGTYKIYVAPWGQKSNEVNFTIITKDAVTGWNIYTDTNYGFEFKYPDNFFFQEPTVAPIDCEYANFSEGCPYINFEGQKIEKSQALAKGMFKVEKITIDNVPFCFWSVSEGAAGSSYITYDYATIKNGRCFSVNLVLRYTDCGVFGGPEEENYKKCEQENTVTKPGILEQVVSTFKFLK